MATELDVDAMTTGSSFRNTEQPVTASDKTVNTAKGQKIRLKNNGSRVCAIFGDITDLVLECRGWHVCRGKMVPEGHLLAERDQLAPRRVRWTTARFTILIHMGNGGVSSLLHNAVKISPSP